MTLWRSARTRAARSARAVVTMARGSLFRGTTAYALAAMTPRLASLLLVPIYTHALNPAEYGQIAIVLTLGLGVQALVSFGLETAVFREFVRTDEPEDRERLTNTFGLFAFAGPTTLALGLGVALAVVAAGPLGVSAASIVLASLAAGLQSAALILPLARLRAEERLGAYVRITVAGAAVGAALTVAAVVWLDLGVEGWFGASLLATMALLLLGLRELRHHWTLQLDRRVLLAALAFGLPLMPHFLSHWGLNVSDRLVLAAFVGHDQIGIYGLAQQFALPASILVIAVSQALMPLYAAGSVHGHTVNLRRVMSDQAEMVGIVCLAVALVAPPAIEILAPIEYVAATDLVGWVILGFLFFGLYLGPMNVVSLTVGRTRWIWVMTAIAALTNVGLNVALIPTWGVLAAAFNTAVGYAVLLTLVHAYLRWFARHPVTYETERLLLAGASMIGVYGVTTVLLPQADALATMIVRLMIVGATAGIMVMMATRRQTTESGDRTERTDG